MKIVIIEDERVVADDLEASIKLLTGDSDIVQLHSVKEAIAYFKNGATPDLIFSDIQLGDGLSFEIFIATPQAAPVIFCTAYNEYALEAFRANGIDYILKPFTRETLERAFQKYGQLKKIFSIDQSQQFSAMIQMMSERNAEKTASVLVYHQDKIIPVKLEDIALVYLENENTHLLTFSGKTYYSNKKLDELERTAGNYFFRANRQFLISRKAIADVSSFFSRKLSINLVFPFKEKIIVSKARSPEFLDWLSKTV
jgi:two-component system response regulator LytT